MLALELSALRSSSRRGPYRVVAADTYNNWGGSTKGSEDPFMWVDKRGHWHVLYHWIAGHANVGGHSFSVDGHSWSNVSAAYGTSRPLDGGRHVSYAAERPKLLFGDDGTTPEVLYCGSSKGTGFTIASPLL